MIPERKTNTCMYLSKSGNVCGQPVVSEDYAFCAEHVHQTDIKNQSDRYDESLPTELLTEYRQQIASPNSKDMSGELAAARTIVASYFRKLESTRTEEGKMVLNNEDMDQIMKAISLTVRVIESQSKVNPDKVITLHDMKKIVEAIIEIIRRNVPVSMMDVRAKIVRDIQKFCMADMISRATEIPFGSTSLPKKRD